MNWEIAQVAHIGGRDEQQDTLMTFSTPNGKTHLLIVADGMGGHKGGSLASQMVIKVAQRAWKKYQQGQEAVNPHKFLRYICELAHRNINRLGRKHHLSPHSTCVLLYIHGKQAWWAHLGDSRLYHFRRHKLLQRTKDHSVVQLLADLGRITEKQMATHPDQGRLLRGLGGEEPIKPDFGQTSVCSGDSFVLCSDGFWEYVLASQIPKRLLLTDFPLKKRVKRLVKDALDAGGAVGDNIAIATAHLKRKKRFYNSDYFLLTLIIMAFLGWGIWYYVMFYF